MSRRAEIKGYSDSGPRVAQLAALLGLTGFAVSQPVLSVAGDNPTLFSFAGVRGPALVLFTLLVAFGPPLLLWVAIVIAGRLHPRAGDALFIAAGVVLVAATTVQVMKAVDIERGNLQFLGGLIAGAVFAVVLVRAPVIATWVRYTAPLPLVAVILMLVASPSASLLRTPSASVVTSDSADIPSVVFIMLDEFPTQSILGPDGQIDAQRFPNLAEFHQDATWYRSYSAMAFKTTSSVPSVLSGQVPRLAEPTWTEYPDTLFSLLAPTHKLSVSETATVLCGFANCGVEGAPTATLDGQGLRSVLGTVADVWRERVMPGRVSQPDLGQFAEDPVPVDQEWTERRQRGLGDLDEVSALPNRVVRFVDALTPGTRSRLDYIHVMLPHQPWVHFPDGQRILTADGSDAHPFSKTRPPTTADWARAVDEQRHLLQVQYTDRVVGAVLDRLRETGQYEESVVVVTADHGISFEKKPYRWLSDSNLPDHAYVPLLVKSPGQAGGVVDDTNLWGVDLLPLLAEELGVKIPWTVAGFAPGDDAIRQRGDQKVMYDFGPGNKEFRSIREFHGKGHPNSSQRLVGPLTVENNLISGLVTRLGVEGQLGVPVDELRGKGEKLGEVRVENLDLWTEPPTDGSVVGDVWGQVSGVDTSGEAVALVAVDGVVVAASPIGPEGWIDALLPPGVIDPEGSELQILISDGDSVFEVEVTEPG